MKIPQRPNQSESQDLKEGRSFGGATAFPASISSDGEHWINCAILIPDLTRHTGSK